MNIIKKNVLVLMLFLCNYNVLFGTTITLNIKDAQLEKNKRGDIVARVGLHQAFQLLIALSDGDDNTANIQIAGLEGFQLLNQGTSTSTSIINGNVSSKTTQYKVLSAQQEGSFTIGPASMVQQGKTISSNTIKIVVVKGAPQSAQQGLEQDAATVKCTLTTNKSSVIVGEPVTLVTKIYSAGNILRMGIANKPTFQGFIVNEQQEPTVGEERLDGTTYQVHQWQTRLIPQQDGAFKIDPVIIQYAVPAPRKKARGGFLGMDIDSYFDAFVGPQGQLRQITSNDLTLQVQPVPEHTKSIDGVGSFTAFKASIDKQNAQQNEPLVFTLSIEGDGNFEQIAIPKLSLPSSCKHYESKTGFTQTPQGGKKQFEFIVQTAKVGSVTIPPQVFSYYDTESKSFKSLTSNPVTIKISKSAHQSSFQQNDVQTQETNIKNQSQSTQSSFLPLVAKSALSQSVSALPWWVFIIVVLCIPCILFYRKLITFAHRLKHKLSSSPKQQLMALGKKLAIIIKKNDAYALHHFFMQFFAIKYNLIQDQITTDILEETLEADGWEKTRVNDFLDYLNKCMQLHFAHEKSSGLDIQALVKKAEYWFIMLKK